MWKWLQRLNPEESGAERIAIHFTRMLDQGRHIYDAAANAFLGGADPSVVRDDLFATDKEINQLERQVRREIVVNTTVHGLSRLPCGLVMMSIVKDAERIGDYCKNVYDLAAIQQKTKDDDYHPDLVKLKDTVSALLGEASEIYTTQDEVRSKDFCRRADALKDHCDDMLHKVVEPEPGTKQPAVVALVYRYHKRIISHLLNIVTSIFLPIDKLDYFDEDHETRG